jgi:death-on-curing protein
VTVYLTKADVLAIAEEILPSVVLRDGGQLHAAVLRPQTTPTLISGPRRRP